MKDAKPSSFIALPFVEEKNPQNYNLYMFELSLLVLRHMQRYFSHICDGTDVQADRRSCTYGRTPDAIDIS